ncbi:MAG: Ig-like domain-containing protein [bacterium]|nr:Ig-like domain-containing protein [bacterium]
MVTIQRKSKLFRVFTLVCCSLILATPVFAAVDIETLSYDSVFFDVGSQDGTPFEVQFNDDGTKMYVLGYDNDIVYQYTLSSAWNPSSASYDSVSFSVATQESVPEGMVFKPDGSEMYIVGIVGDDVNQYTLSTPWDLSSASYTGVSISNSSRDATTVKVQFNDDGSKMFMLGFITGDIFQHTLSTPWDVTSATYDSVSFSTSEQTSNPYAMAFSPNGDRILAVGGSDIGYQYNLTTPWDITTASYASKFYDFTEDTNVYGLTFKPDETKLFMAGASGNDIFRYSFADEVNPTLSSSSPADDEIGVAIDANIVLTFSEEVNVESGNVTIKRASDDGTFEQIDITSEQVTGDGTTQITINPSSSFVSATGYYIEIDATAIDDTSSNSYAGISDSTVLNFTTVASQGSNYQYVQKPQAVPVIEERFTCEAPNRIQLSFSNVINADYYRYTTVNDAATYGDWRAFTEEGIHVDMPGQAGDSVTFYFQLKGSIGPITSAQPISIVIPELSCDTSEVEADGDEFIDDIGGEEIRTGLSPYTGEIEVIDDVEPGMLIRGASYSAVYLITDQMERRPFTRHTIFFTYFDDFDDVVVVTDATLPTLHLGLAMLPNPGRVLVKTQFNDEAYEISDDYSLRRLASEEDAQERYGDDWADYVIDMNEVLLLRMMQNGLDSASGNWHSDMRTRLDIERLAAEM